MHRRRSTDHDDADDPPSSHHPHEKNSQKKKPAHRASDYVIEQSKIFLVQEMKNQATYDCMIKLQEGKASKENTKNTSVKVEAEKKTLVACRSSAEKSDC